MVLREGEKTQPNICSDSASVAREKYFSNNFALFYIQIYLLTNQRAVP